MSLAQRIVSAALLVLATACSEVNPSCEPYGAVTPICGAQMPEDLEAIPDAGGILISEYGHAGAYPGALSWLQPEISQKIIRLVDSDNIATGESEINWGAATCSAPSVLSPHGIHLAERGDTLQLLVVNHSETEQVLFYEVQADANSSAPPTLAWRGCVDFPEIAVLNDVAALPDGGFAVTHMYDRENLTLAQVKSAIGLNNGHVWRWSPGSEPRVIANSEARLPNGIEVAADGKSIWVNNYIEQELRQYNLQTEEITKRISVANIDNSAWISDGRLLLASHLSPLTMGACFELTKGSCGSPYELIAVDTQSGETETIFRSSDDEPFGPATVAIEYAGKLYAGSFSGDRLAEIDLKK